MGLDIAILTDNPAHLYTEYFLHSSSGMKGLSRTFCQLMFRRHAISGEPELDQIGRITSVDISPLYEMETYKEENSDEIDFLLSVAESDNERQEILERVRRENNALKENIFKVLSTIDQMIGKLSITDDLPDLLINFGSDILNYKYYFTDFNIDKGEGYIGNNFGQDMRNFKGFLEYAKEKGATTVYFSYG